MIYKLDEINERLGRIEQELMGKVGDREGGVMIRLDRVERIVRMFIWVLTVIAVVVLGLAATRAWQLFIGPDHPQTTRTTP